MADFPFLPDHNRLIDERYQKVEELRARGVDPYPARWDATHSTGQLKQLAQPVLDQPEALTALGEFSLLGRVLTIRSFGKAAFFHLRDRDGQLQVYLKAGETDEAGYALYKEKLLEGGDLAGVRGTLFITKTGELTLQAKQLILAAKAVRQLPEKWRGLTDKETRYRQRYVDLIANPQVAETFRTRSRVVSAMRRFLEDNHFMEVETPMMHPIYGGAMARPFKTHHNALDMTLYLRIAPELYLKRLIVGGLGRVYEINRNFRNEGISVRHNPEFTMMELYAEGWDASVQMDFVEDMIRTVAQASTGRVKFANEAGEEIDLGQPFRRVTILELVREATGAALSWDMTLSEVKAAVPNHPIPSEKTTAADAIIFLFEEHGEPLCLQPTFVQEFPKIISPLAKSFPGRPEIADRFEFLVNRQELANAYSELNDPREQFERFAEQVGRRAGGDLEAVNEIDEDYVRALEYGMPMASGLGVGVDRLAMLLTESASIRDVILFPLMKPKAVTAEDDNEASAE